MTALKMYKQRAAAAAAAQEAPASVPTTAQPQHREHHDQPTISAASSGPSNPLFTLVDAATSLLENEESQEPRSSTPSTTAESSFPNTSVPSKSESSPTSVARQAPPSYFLPGEKQQQSFAETLMSMLLDKQYSKVVTFLPDGNSWGIIHAKKFSDEVMPKVFGIRTFSSFVRKLTRWGFERVMEKKTHEVDVFRHDLFRKGDWTSCAKIRCGGGARQHQQNHQARQSELFAKAVAVTQQSRAALALSQRQQQQQQLLKLHQQRRLEGLANMGLSAASLFQERRKSDTAMLRSSAVNSATRFAAAAARRPSDPTHPATTATLSDVTSQVVGEALATLRRDPNIAAVQQARRQEQQSLVQQQLLHEEMRKLEAQQQRLALLTGQISSSSSPRSSLGYYGLGL